MKLLQLYNLLNAPTERAMQTVPAALARAGAQLHTVFERSADGRTLETAPWPGPRHRVDRVRVDPPPGDPRRAEHAAAIDRQMHAVADRLEAAGPGTPWPALLRQRFDALHGHFGPRVLHASPWLRRGTPVVVSLYGYDTGRLLRDPAWMARYRWAAAHGATFVTLSRDMQTRMVARGLPPAATRHIPLGIDLPRWPFNPQPAPAAARFLFVGRLTAKKAPLDAVRAAAALPGVHLDVIGGGELDADARSLARDLGAADRVHFHGPQPFDRLPGWLARATALVLPSVVADDGDREGCPMILMQAAAAGTPCVTTRHAGNPEALPPEAHAHALAPERDPVALAAALDRVAALAPDARRGLQHAGRRHVERHFDARHTVAAYRTLFEERAAAPPAPARFAPPLSPTPPA